MDPSRRLWAGESNETPGIVSPRYAGGAARAVRMKNPRARHTPSAVEERARHAANIENWKKHIPLGQVVDADKGTLIEFFSNPGLSTPVLQPLRANANPSQETAPPPSDLQSLKTSKVEAIQSKEDKGILELNSRTEAKNEHGELDIAASGSRENNLATSLLITNISSDLEVKCMFSPQAWKTVVWLGRRDDSFEVHFRSHAQARAALDELPDEYKRQSSPTARLPYVEWINPFEKRKPLVLRISSLPIENPQSRASSESGRSIEMLASSAASRPSWNCGTESNSLVVHNLEDVHKVRSLFHSQDRIKSVLRLDFASEHQVNFWTHGEAKAALMRLPSQYTCVDFANAQDIPFITWCDPKYRTRASLQSPETEEDSAQNDNPPRGVIMQAGKSNEAAISTSEETSNSPPASTSIVKDSKLGGSSASTVNKSLTATPENSDPRASPKLEEPQIPKGGGDDAMKKIPRTANDENRILEVINVETAEQAREILPAQGQMGIQFISKDGNSFLVQFSTQKYAETSWDWLSLEHKQHFQSDAPKPYVKWWHHFAEPATPSIIRHVHVSENAENSNNVASNSIELGSTRNLSTTDVESTDETRPFFPTPIEQHLTSINSFDKDFSFKISREKHSEDALARHPVKLDSDTAASIQLTKIKPTEASRAMSRSSISAERIPLHSTIKPNAPADETDPATTMTESSGDMDPHRVLIILGMASATKARDLFHPHDVEHIISVDKVGESYFQATFSTARQAELALCSLPEEYRSFDPEHPRIPKVDLYPSCDFSEWTEPQAPARYIEQILELQSTGRAILRPRGPGSIYLTSEEGLGDSGASDQAVQGAPHNEPPHETPQSKLASRPSIEGRRRSTTQAEFTVQKEVTLTAPAASTRVQEPNRISCLHEQSQHAAIYGPTKASFLTQVEEAMAKKDTLVQGPSQPVFAPTNRAPMFNCSNTQTSTAMTEISDATERADVRSLTSSINSTRLLITVQRPNFRNRVKIIRLSRFPDLSNGESDSSGSSHSLFLLKAVGISAGDVGKYEIMWMKEAQDNAVEEVELDGEDAWEYLKESVEDQGMKEVKLTVMKKGVVAGCDVDLAC